MNEHIKQLKEQAMEWVPNMADPDTKIKLLNAEKFAELIVQECAQVSEDDITDGDACCTNTADRIARQIKKHFGVELDITTHKTKLTTDPERIRQANFLLKCGR